MTKAKTTSQKLGGKLNDADTVKVKETKELMSVEQVIAEFEAKNCYLEEYCVEYDLETFLSLVFERDALREDDVPPMEEIKSREYLLWKRQKEEKKGKRGNAAKIDYSGYTCWRYNPIVFYQEKGEEKTKNRHRLILKDDKASIAFLKERQFAIMAPVTYVGKNNTKVNARYMYGFCFDIDEVNLFNLSKIFELSCKRSAQLGGIPKPNLITNSGHGVHLYYLLESPVPMYGGVINMLNHMKRGLTNVLWNPGTSSSKNRQHQGVTQGFRLPGTLTKFGKRIRVFGWRKKLYTLEELNEYLSTYKLSPAELDFCKGKGSLNPNGVTLAEAKKRWPEWYARKVEKRGSKKIYKTTWNLRPQVYDWWLKKLRKADNEIFVGNRYWCIVTLVAYGVKCNIPKYKVEADAMSLLPKMDGYTAKETEHFTRGDIKDAMQAYKEESARLSINGIEKLTRIQIERSRRNGRKQKDHLVRARFSRDLEHENWREGNGRPEATPENSKECATIAKWRQENPDCTNKSRCARETGLHRNTVTKWWNPEEAVKKVRKRKVAEKLAKIEAKLEQIPLRGGVYSPEGLKKALDAKETPIEHTIVVNMAQLFADKDNAEGVAGYTRQETIDIVTSGRWKELGWKLE